MKKDCLHCGNEFEAKRSTARFCGDKCRVYHARENRGVVSNQPQGKEIPPVIVESPAEQTGPNIAQPKLYRGVPEPEGVKGWDLTVWKAGIIDQQKQTVK